MIVMPRPVPSRPAPVHAAWFVMERLHACICSWIPGACGQQGRVAPQTAAQVLDTHDQLLRVTVPLGYVYVPSIERIPFGVWSPAERMLSGAPCMQAKMVCALYYVAWEGGGQEGTGRALHCRNGSLSSSMGQRLFVWNSAKKGGGGGGGGGHKVPPFPVISRHSKPFLLFYLFRFALHSFFFWICLLAGPRAFPPWAGASFGSYITRTRLLLCVAGQWGLLHY